MEDSLKEYQRCITMQLEDWLLEPVSRDSDVRAKLIGTAVAILGTKAALNNRVLHSDEFKAVSRLVQDYALLNQPEAHSLTYFAMKTRGNPHLEGLSIDIIVQELGASDLIQFLDRFVEILEMDGLICSRDARLLTELYGLIQRSVEKGFQKATATQSELVSSVRLLIDSVLEDSESTPYKKKPTQLKKAS